MMSRMKSIFGNQIRSRIFENQYTDLMIRCHIINKMNEFGLPKSNPLPHATRGGEGSREGNLQQRRFIH
ncbi:hypothetical protein EBU95_19875 [bacterium]|nr:hypothetical protein [bacterium]